MELGDIIEWVDRINNDFKNLLYCIKEDLPLSEAVSCNDINIDRFDCVKATTEKMLYLSADNKIAFVKRLFRDSGVFFKEIASRDFNNKYDAILANDPLLEDLESSKITFKEYLTIWREPRIDNMLDFTFGVYCDLRFFYCQIIQFSIECGLNPMDFIIPEAKDFVNDIIEHYNMPPQEKIEAQKLLLQTKWQDFIIGKNKDAWVDLIITEMHNASKMHNARLMAAIIAALQQSGAIIDLSSKGKKKEFYKLLKKDFSHLNTYEAVYKPFRDGEKPVREDEITAILTKISCR